MDIFEEVDKIIAQHEARTLTNKLDTANIIKPSVENGLLTPKRDADLRETLARAFGDTDNKIIRVDSDNFIDDDDDDNITDDVIVAPEYTRVLTAAQEKPIKLEPRPYQQVAIDFLKEKRRAMLTDQAGLGKTLEAALAAKTPCLVIAPTYLTEQWYNFLCAQFPNDAKRGQIVWAKGSRMRRIKAFKQRAKWTVINIQMLRTFYEYVPVEHYDTIIIDEAHHIRNRKAAQSKLAAAICKGVNKRVYLLTATPIWKNPDDLWMLLHTLQPSLFPEYADFVDLFCNTELDAYQGIKVVGIKRSMTRALNELLNVVRLGRSYKEAGRALPPKTYHFIKVDFPKELMKKYNELKMYWSMQLEGLEGNGRLAFSSYGAVLSTLRTLSAWDGKVAALLECMTDVMAGENPAPATVFCWYKRHAAMLYRCLKVKFPDKRVVLITGDVKASDRPRIALEADIVVATISSMSEGVNLYHHRSVHYFEENWVPGSNYQSLSRVVRDRNDDGENMEPVRVFFYHTRGTIDERIHAMTKAREGTIKQLISESLQ